MTGAIYQIKNLVNNKIYIGSTKNFLIRKQEHWHRLKSKKHENFYLQNAWNKYGEHNFVFEILEKIEDEEKLLVKEQEYIDVYSPDYNICKSAGKPPTKFGENHPNSKLKFTQVCEIREIYKDEKISKAFLAKKYGICIGTLTEILQNIIWVDKNYSPTDRKPFSKSKLTFEDAQKIRDLYLFKEKTCVEISKIYNVSPSTIESIVKNTMYKDDDYVSPGKYFRKRKLNWEQVKEIRNLYKNKIKNQYELAKIFKVSRGAIEAIVMNKSWNK
jgi:group I intron endonuclease